LGFQLINTHYFYRDRKKGMEFDKIMFILKDENGNKTRKIIEKPVLTYYVSKPQYWDDKLRYYIDQDKVVPVRCYSKDLYRSIVDTLNDDRLSAYYKESLNSGFDIGRKLSRIHLDNRLHGSDVNVQDYYISEFLKKYPLDDNNYGLTKVFFDIEVDTENIDGFPEPEEAEAPVNIMTLVDADNLKCYTYCLTYEHDTYIQTMENIDKIKEKLEVKYKDILKGREMEFIINEYDSEIDLIQAFYDAINIDIRPDFVIAWNGHGFDNVYMINRVIRLGYQPEDIMCPKEFEYKKVSYRKDTRNQDPADSKSEVNITSYSIYMDAMNVYANLRKAMGKEESYSLDYIGQKEVGLTKDKMEGDFSTFHKLDYESFMLYNIQDTVMMMMMEEKNNDMGAMYSLAMLTHTRIEKAMSKTVCLRNLASLYYQEEGAYISNNRAKIREQTEGKIRGGFVADPNLVEEVGMEILFKKSNHIFENNIDFDLSSLYPSIILAFNISPETCYGRATVMDENDNDVSHEFTEDYASRDYVNFGTKWLGMPTVTDIAKIVKETIAV
jgi:DNA polymerase elongation subunit (family B)